MGHLRELPFSENDPGGETRSDARLRKESRELAEQDGRADARVGDREQASNAAVWAGESAAQEIPPGAEDLVTWNVSPDDAGHLVEEMEADDEADVGAEMAEQGRNDADRDLRRAARANRG